MTGYPSRPVPVDPGPCECGECNPCLYQSCKEPSLGAYGKRLCMGHGTEANRMLEAIGLGLGTGSTWEVKCAAVGKWLDARQLREAREA